MSLGPSTSGPRMTAGTLIVANAVPLVGVLAFGWGLHSLLVIYWVESAVVGTASVAKILRAEGEDDPTELPSMKFNDRSVGSFVGESNRRIATFFVSHYGVFWLVHGLFVGIFPLIFPRMAWTSPRVVAAGRRPRRLPRRLLSGQLPRPRGVRTQRPGDPDGRTLPTRPRVARHDNSRRVRRRRARFPRGRARRDGSAEDDTRLPGSLEGTRPGPAAGRSGRCGKPGVILSATSDATAPVAVSGSSRCVSPNVDKHVHVLVFDSTGSGLPMTRFRLAHQRWERGRSQRPVTPTRLETSIQHAAGIPPVVEAPAFTPGEDVTSRAIHSYSESTNRNSGSPQSGHSS